MLQKSTLIYYDHNILVSREVHKHGLHVQVSQLTLNKLSSELPCWGVPEQSSNPSVCSFVEDIPHFLLRCAKLQKSRRGPLKRTALLQDIGVQPKEGDTMCRVILNGGNGNMEIYQMVTPLRSLR